MTAACATNQPWHHISKEAVLEPTFATKKPVLPVHASSRNLQPAYRQKCECWLELLHTYAARYYNIGDLNLCKNVSACCAARKVGSRPAPLNYSQGGSWGEGSARPYPSTN